MVVETSLLPHFDVFQRQKNQVMKMSNHMFLEGQEEEEKGFCIKFITRHKRFHSTRHTNNGQDIHYQIRQKKPLLLCYGSPGFVTPKLGGMAPYRIVTTHNRVSQMNFSLIKKKQQQISYPKRIICFFVNLPTNSQLIAPTFYSEE